MVGHDPVFEAKKRIQNRFELCVVTFERAKQLIKGARPRTDKRYNSPVTTALEEIATDTIKAPESGDEWQLD
jgi:DNA-directed RNA polymerase omega subunit